MSIRPTIKIAYFFVDKYFSAKKKAANILFAARSYQVILQMHERFLSLCRLARDEASESASWVLR